LESSPWTEAQSVFFPVSKLLWLLLRPSNILLILLCAGVLLLRRRERLGRRLIGVSAVAFALVAVVPVWAWLIAPLESRFPSPEPITEAPDGIVVLGGALGTEITRLHGQIMLNGASERLVAMANLGRRFPRARIIYTGGSSSLRTPELRAAHYIPEVAQQLGLDSNRVELEAKARNTFENARESLALAAPKPGQTWLLVSSAAHMPRSVGCFRKVGFPVLPYPVDFRAGLDGWRLDFRLGPNLQRLDEVAKEWVGLLVYYLSDRTESLLPGP
jgi:uncharacterized SAM-binding protein YcdF (DUF218 family)